MPDDQTVKTLLAQLDSFELNLDLLHNQKT